MNIKPERKGAAGVSYELVCHARAERESLMIQISESERMIKQSRQQVARLDGLLARLEDR